MKHPKLDDKGNPVHLYKPHSCTTAGSWSDSVALATAVPGCDLPAEVNGIKLLRWSDPPRSASDWNVLTGDFEEPSFAAAPGRKLASGAVIVESDERIWMVSPSNAFGGYVNTFPKGTFLGEDVANLRANAVKEVYEETGLKVRLIAFLCDSERSTSTTRYYLAERLGGSPAEMGWESQAVHLVPPHLVDTVASHPNDQGILQALRKKAS